MQFLTNLGPLFIVIMIVIIPIFKVLWGKDLVATDKDRASIMHFREAESITDKHLLIISLTILVLVIIGFIVGEHYNIPPGTIAIFGAPILVLAASFKMSSAEQADLLHGALLEVEWAALLFFIGLFVIVSGVEHSGLLDILGTQLVHFTGGDMATTAFATLWLSAIVSAAVDNISFVATMIPMVQSMAPSLGGTEALEPIWWSLALGACLGGNGSLVGAASNVMVAGLGERAGYPIRFFQFLKIGLPLMLLTIAIAHVYIYLRYFM